jgi:phosphatidylglycerophosphatase A
VGHIPIGSGTAACAAVYGVYLAARAAGGALDAPGAFEPMSTAVMLVLAAGFSAATVAWGRKAELAYGREDPHEVVSDEAASAFLALAGAGWLRWWWAAGAGFALLRFFDIAKPLGIRRLERLPGGVGILMDDLAAAAATQAVLWLTALGLHWTGTTDALLAM